MSFNTFESSEAQGGPVQLYLFRYGTEAGEYYAYTDHTQPIEVDHGGALGVIDYQPVPASRENIIANGTLDRAALAINLDISTDLSELFRVYPPSSVVSLSVFQGHVDDPDDEFLAIWAGRLMSAGRETNDLVLQGEPISTSMRRPGLRRNYQYGCPLWLFGPDCRASEAGATVSGTIASINGNILTMNAGWEGAFPPDKFVRGMIKWTPAGEATRRRTIIRRAGNVLTLAGLPSGLVATDAIDLVVGCNHKAFTLSGGDCQAIHDNILNYGGQPWIPITGVVNTNPYY